MIKYGKNNGFDIYRDPMVSKSFVCSREATEAEYSDQDKTYKLFNQKIKASANSVGGDALWLGCPGIIRSMGYRNRLRRGWCEDEFHSGSHKSEGCHSYVSVGVLANNRIKFTPELPVKKQEAIDGIDVAIAYSLDGMKGMLGNDIEKKFIKGYATTTGKIPFWDGSYSTAKPGKQPMRKELGQNHGSDLVRAFSIR
ncbi:MAG: hypothetical protein GY820_14020 [Gammaproteobacteria bacterium]|nr:hypothetical protein [Gammaproteobacteria bacterium]